MGLFNSPRRGAPLRSPREIVREGRSLQVPRPRHAPRDPDGVYPAQREELMPIALASLVLAFLALLICTVRGWLLLYGDAVAHLGIARRILDARYPGLAQLGGVWLPLPHLLMAPFAQRMDWWQSGLAGAFPSMAAYLFAVVGCYKLARRLVSAPWSFAATAFFALNPNMLYLSTTAMTEPLFLALLIWSTILALETVDALREGKAYVAGTRMLYSGVVTLAMVLTRYDGWIVGAVVWVVIALAWYRSEPRIRDKSQTALIVMTLLALAGPALWLSYNAVYQHDWLDFLRGPYSAAAIERKSTPPGAQHYRGWHNPLWALIYYVRTAQADAAAWETGFALTLAAAWGAWLLWKRKAMRIVLLLWLPLPFYVYSLAWGSVPIFIPQIYAHAYYNTRYGMELLPALAIGTVCALAWLFDRVKPTRPKLAEGIYFASLLLIVLNGIAMMGTVGTVLERVTGHTPEWLAAPPLVFQEGVVNSRTRIPFERMLARELLHAPPGSIIMIDTTDHIGAVQTAGLSLKSLISPLDSQSFDRAKEAPARYANLVIALDGDPVAKAVAAHPEGLAEIEILCQTGQPCAHLYRSDSITAGGR